MPPNVKETASVIDSLARLNVNDLVHGKFLPLTQEVEAEEQEAQSNKILQVSTQEDTIAAPLSSQEQLIADILKDEENREMFTIDHLESNLIQEAKGKMEMEDYWDMPAPTQEEAMMAAQEEDELIKEEEKSDNAAKVNGDLYCLWHIKHEEQTRQELIESIVEEERRRQMFSVNSIEVALVADAERRGYDACSGEHDATIHPETDSYWMWEMEA